MLEILSSGVLAAKRDVRLFPTWCVSLDCMATAHRDGDRAEDGRRKTDRQRILQTSAFGFGPVGIDFILQYISRDTYSKAHNMRRIISNLSLLGALLLSVPSKAFHFDGSKSAIGGIESLTEVVKENRSRRDVLSICAKATSGAAFLSIGMPFFPSEAAAAGSDFAALRDKVAEARRQLDPVPNLIKEEKWDSIRAILITPPLSDCWGKSSGANPLLRNYAEAVGDQGGDELAALEAREDALDHLRFLDMAAYNNVFNPIKTEGETGATKGLIKSYYEDPVNELKASTAALDELIKLGEI